MVKTALFLPQTFAYAGAKSIVTSLWSVQDEQTKNLMLRFYRHLKKGLPKDEALRQAKLGYLAKCAPERAHPYYWAGFVGIGDMRALEF